MADKTYRLTFGLSDGSEKAVAFTAPQGETGKTAYEYAVDGGYTGTEEEFAAKLAEELPAALKNPNALTINGTAYDGSEAVAVDTTAFYVNFALGDTENDINYEMSADKTYAEIQEAYNAGRAVIGVLEGAVFATMNSTGNQFEALFDLLPFAYLQGVLWVWFDADGSCTGNFIFDTLSVTVTASGNNYTSDVTFEDIYTNLSAGANSICTLDNGSGGVTLNLLGYSDSSIIYGGIFGNILMTATISASNVVSVASSTLLTTDNDTKNTAGATNVVDAKLYLVGAKMQASSPLTYTNANCYIGTDNRLYSGGALVPNVAEITALIEAQLGVIENGAY